jgi:predicted HTH domain antitoxin
MEKRAVTIHLPVEVFSIFKKEPEDFTNEMRLTAAVKWYDMGIISQEKAAEVAGISREEFIFSLKRFGVSPFQYTAQEILYEAGYGSDVALSKI